MPKTEIEKGSRERGLILKPWEVQAVLDSRMSMFVRPVKPQPESVDMETHRVIPFNGTADMLMRQLRCPFGTIGDRLWCKETFCPRSNGQLSLECIQRPFYRATDGDGDIRKPLAWLWRSATQMQRRYSRLTVSVTDVRVVRLKEASEEAARAMGFKRLTKDQGRTWKWGIPDRDGLPGNDDYGWPWVKWCTSYHAAIAQQWNATAKPDMMFSANPWVWLISFTRVDA